MVDEQVKQKRSLRLLAGRLICLSGIDGTGKTTLALKLREELDSLGITANYIWFRNARFLSVPFLALLYAAGFAERPTINGKRVGIYYFYKNKTVARSWLWIAALDMFVVSLLKIKLPLWRGKTVIADRYVVDAVVDLVSDTGITNLNSFPYRLLLGLLDRRSVAAILTVDNRESLRRKDDSISLEYLTQRQHLYASIARELGIPMIDANQSVDTVWSRVASALVRQTEVYE